MADSSADEESVEEYHSASDGGLSDFSVSVGVQRVVVRGLQHQRAHMQRALGEVYAGIDPSSITTWAKAG